MYRIMYRYSFPGDTSRCSHNELPQIIRIRYIKHIVLYIFIIYILLLFFNTFEINLYYIFLSTTKIAYIVKYNMHFKVKYICISWYFNILNIFSNIINSCLGCRQLWMNWTVSLSQAQQSYIKLRFIAFLWRLYHI